MNIDLLQLIFGFILAALVSYYAHRVKTLSLSGAWAAFILGACIFGLGGFSWAILLLGFFISSSALSRAFKKRKQNLNEKFSKGSIRDSGQVLANGGIAGIFAIMHFIFPLSDWTWWAFAGALAAVNADTWATELGVLSHSQPRLITNGTIVERGESGGISVIGTVASASGALFIALLAMVTWQASSISTPPNMAIAVGAITIAGLVGSLIDSYLGATLQSIYTCPTCNKDTERHPFHLCGTPTQYKRGLRWMNNDWVNTFCSLAGAISALLFSRF